ncbi:sulfite exporter TauE/SafE family protein [Maritalea sp.]|uniref:sulfite exporter TauE/SafE family protein n=1 Tax=Maritalea sp. TaxID=2003361 RepID=UPI003EFB0A4D
MDQLIELVPTLLPMALWLVGAGVAAGIMAGLLGVGGGIVMVPVMATIFQLMGISPDILMHIAVATSLAVIVPTGISSARSHAKRGAVSRDLLVLWAPAMVVASFLGGLSAGFYSAFTLRIVFGVMAFFIAINSIVPLQKMLMGGLSNSPITHRVSATFIGYISSLMGIGGGSLSVPTMTVLGTPVHTAVGTSSALGVFIAFPAVIGFVISGWNVADLPALSVGYVSIPAMAMLAIGAILFAPVGAMIAHKLSATLLKRVLAVYLLIVGTRMIIQALFG